MSDKMFILNTAKLIPRWGENWQFFEVDVPEWNAKYFNKIVQFRQSHEHMDYILESSGRRLIGIPRTNRKIEWPNEIDNWDKTLSKTLSKEVHITPISNPFITKCIQDDDILAIREALGGLIASRLTEMGFEKVSSKGSVGRFYHPNMSEKKSLENGRIILRHLWEFTVTLDETHEVGKNAFLSIDLKTEVCGEETLLDLIHYRKRDIDVKHWPGDQKRWKINNLIVKKFPNVKKELRLVVIESLKVGLDKPMNLIRFGDYKNATVRQFTLGQGIHLSENDYIGVLKDKSRSTKDPNIEYRIPASLLEHNITNNSIKNRGWEREFHRFSKFPLMERYKKIQGMFDFLSKNGLVDSPIHFFGINPKIAYPSVRGWREKNFGQKIDLSKQGVQDWGALCKVIIYIESRNKGFARKLKDELENQLSVISKKTEIATPTVELIETSYQTNKIQQFAEQITNKPWDALHLFIGFKENEYKSIKTLFTHQNRKPVQFIQPKNLKGNIFPLVRTLIPQLIAKTGGLPYRLNPPLLDNTLIIGLDKARDSSSTRPSASAGVAAVTPEGRYVAGASTPLDSSKHDRIDVDVLAPQLLQNLSDFQNKLDYVVILRDGAPATCSSEVKAWRKHLSESGLGFVFLASRKQNPYRIFPDLRNVKGKYVRYKLPVIMNGPPLAPSDFLVITANPPQGTARPVLYTIMENTANLPEETIKEKVIAQVVSMSMLCWESPFPTSQPLPLHYADKLAAFTQITQQAWISTNKYPMFI